MATYLCRPSPQLAVLLASYNCRSTVGFGTSSVSTAVSSVSAAGVCVYYKLARVWSEIIHFLHISWSFEFYCVWLWYLHMAAVVQLIFLLLAPESPATPGSCSNSAAEAQGNFCKLLGGMASVLACLSAGQVHSSSHTILL